MFFSKPGGAVTSMRVMDGPDPKLNAYTFVFSSSKAVADGQNFKDHITNILTQNLAQQAQQAARAEAATTDAQAAAPIQVTPRADRPLSSNDLRKFVLLKRADLAALHRELVIPGNITEAEFWAGREVCFSGHLRKAKPNRRPSISFPLKSLLSDNARVVQLRCWNYEPRQQTNVATSKLQSHPSVPNRYLLNSLS